VESQGSEGSNPSLSDTMEPVKIMTFQHLLHRILHGLAFFPFIGWVFPLYLKSEDETIQKNAKVGLLLAFYTVSIYIFLIAIEFLLPSVLIHVSYAINSIIYAMLIIYFIILLIGIVFTQNNKVYKLPIIHSIATSLNI
jgi:uncharacterized membrane protein